MVTCKALAKTRPGVVVMWALMCALIHAFQLFEGTATTAKPKRDSDCLCSGLEGREGLCRSLLMSMP
jgi:hypothetical protein